MYVRAKIWSETEPARSREQVGTRGRDGRALLME